MLHTSPECYALSGLFSSMQECQVDR